MDAYRVLGWVVPSLCILGAGLVIYNRITEFQKSSAAQLKANADFETATIKKAEVDKAPVERRYAGVNFSPMEETQFLTELKDRAHATGTELSKWTSKATTYGQQGAAVPADPTSLELLKGITRIDCDLTVSGSYGALRQFVQGLFDSDRLYTVNNVNWSRQFTGSGAESTQLNVSLARYVLPAAKPGAATSAAIGSGPSASGPSGLGAGGSEGIAKS